MSRTIRCYNKEPVLGGPGLKGFAKSFPKDKVPEWVKWHYLYEPLKSNVCVGNCKYCRSWRRYKEPRLIRRKNRRAEIALEKVGHLRWGSEFIYDRDDGSA